MEGGEGRRRGATGEAAHLVIFFLIGLGLVVDLGLEVDGAV